MDVSQIAKRFPLVARPRPACPPLAERVREITDLAAAAERDGNVTSATVALNKAALIASDCGMPDLARTLCWRHTEAVLRAQPLGAQEARYALEPLVNLARLRIRDGDGHGAYHLLDSLNRAVRSKTEAVIDGRTKSFQHLTTSAADHEQVCQWLWTVLLSDGTRALVAAGEWDRARAHNRQHRGIGQHLFDGRQVEVLVRCLGEQPSDALTLLHKSQLVEPWEHSVAAALTVLCYRAADEHPIEPIDKMVQHYLALDSAPELAVFRSRVGLVVLDLSPKTRQAEPMRRLTSEATTQADGYLAGDVLAHPVCREGLNQDERKTLSATVASAGLGQGNIPEPLAQALRDASAVAAGVWERHADRRANARPSPSPRIEAPNSPG
ncbi:hypothetical protein GCM10010095_21750 [Streptomyces anthocyanicus]|uniref:hypothetical protein n=1 Tax=Streptomyces anthocyanicus TaxID=68174 RepID=UPI001670FD0D|nr:hypothetical protein [Streptomyces anthocyanicus]GGL36167.1 hypothetical protein GCM10010095_21750 [Streptomyces anthocyanicus]